LGCCAPVLLGIFKGLQRQRRERKPELPRANPCGKTLALATAPFGKPASSFALAWPGACELGRKISDGQQQRRDDSGKERNLAQRIPTGISTSRTSALAGDNTCAAFGADRHVTFPKLEPEHSKQQQQHDRGCYGNDNRTQAAKAV
jgi:hypothetical protein